MTRALPGLLVLLATIAAWSLALMLLAGCSARIQKIADGPGWARYEVTIRLGVAAIPREQIP
mgnify:CR=1 FL=1